MASADSLPDPQYADALASAVIATQFHAQDELGQYTYGFDNPTARKVETKTADGVVEGFYSYASPDGRIITNQYRADPVNGFQSSLAPANGEPHPVVLPVAPAPGQPAVAVDAVADVAIAAGAYADAAAVLDEPVVYDPDPRPAPADRGTCRPRLRSAPHHGPPAIR